MEKMITYDLYRIYGRIPKDVSIKDRIIVECNPVVKCIKLFRKASKGGLIARLRYTFISRKYAIEIPIATKIGGGLYLPHNGRRTINSEAILGCNITIHPGVTIGKEPRGKRQGAPVIGNNVWIGANSIIVGKISIGDNVLIVPGTFVNFDVKSNAIVIGNPGRVIEKADAVTGYIKNIIEDEGMKFF